MEARLHHSRTLLLLAPTANPSPAPAAPGIPDAGRAFTWLNTNAVVALALLICGVVAAIALHVALQCALRATRRVCYGAGDALHEPPRAGGGRAPGQAPRHGGGRKRGALVQALPCVAYSAGLELTGSSRSECAICLGQFALGEPVRVLPRCNHGFHARCIDRWLAARPTCPTCRQAPFAEPEHVLADRAGPAVVPVVRVMVGASLRVEL